jgi:hypothetical protein
MIKKDSLILMLYTFSDQEMKNGDFGSSFYDGQLRPKDKTTRAANPFRKAENHFGHDLEKF